MSAAVTAPAFPTALKPLLRHSRWICWAWVQNGVNAETSEPKWDKQPRQPRFPRLNASTKKPAQWTNYAIAAAQANAGHASGVGYVLTDDSEHVFIDLDDCRDPQSGAIAPWAAAVVQAAGSYTELTPSGAGLRVIGLRGSIEQPISRAYRVPDGSGGSGGSGEIYFNATRYVTVTFNRLPGTPDVLAPLDRIVDWMLGTYGKPEPTSDRVRQSAEPQAPLEDVKSALVAIPNADLPWEGWNRIAMAAWAATGGSEEGYEAFQAWSARSAKHDGATTDAKWEAIRNSPPDAIGAGTLFYEARQADPRWTPPSQTRTHEQAAAVFTAMGPLPPPPPGGLVASGVAPGPTAPLQPGKKDGKENPRDIVVRAVLAPNPTFWRNPDHRTHVTITRDGRKERYVVDSDDFRQVVREIIGRARSYQQPDGSVTPGSVSTNILKDAITTLEAHGLDGKVMSPEVRVCGDGPNVWLDLGDPSWRPIFVTPYGWCPIPGTDLPLLRPPGMRALPMPVRSPHAMAALRRLLNIERESDFQLVVAWLVAALYPRGPYAVLALDGEAGSGKSTAAKMLRRLVDPNAAENRAPPRDIDDLILAASNSRVMSLDNLSYVDNDMADSLCRLATGAGFAKRRLYSDGSEYILNVCRPIILNGIPSLLARGDLADRALAITLPPIPASGRRPEADVWAEFAAAAPGILAALLDGLVLVLRDVPRLELAKLPRMADFCRIAYAAAPAFGWNGEDMVRAMEENAEGAIMAVVEGDPVAVAVMGLATRGRWQGTGTELLSIIGADTPLDVTRERGWPKDANRLTARLKRAAPALRRMGVEVTLPKSGGRNGRRITIEGVPGMQLPASIAGNAGGTLASVAAFREKVAFAEGCGGGNAGTPGTPIFPNSASSPLAAALPPSYSSPYVCH